MRRRFACRRPIQPLGCLPAVALAFAMGVILALTCSYGFVVVLLSLLLVCIIFSACC